MSDGFLEFNEVERQVIDELAKEKALSRMGVLRQALRLYQFVDRRLADGEKISFSGDAARAAAFLGRELVEGPLGQSRLDREN